MASCRQVLAARVGPVPTQRELCAGTERVNEGCASLGKGDAETPRSRVVTWAGPSQGGMTRQRRGDSCQCWVSTCLWVSRQGWLCHTRPSGWHGFPGPAWRVQSHVQLWAPRSARRQGDSPALNRSRIQIKHLAVVMWFHLAPKSGLATSPFGLEYPTDRLWLEPMCEPRPPQAASFAQGWGTQKEGLSEGPLG